MVFSKWSTSIKRRNNGRIKTILGIQKQNKQKTHTQNYRQRIIRRGFTKSLLPEIAEKRYHKLKQKQLENREINSFKDVFNLIAEKHDEITLYPYHLEPFIEAVEKSLEENVKIVLHSPPRHSKSICSLIAFMYHCIKKSKSKHFYITYNETRAEEVADDFFWLCKFIGLKCHKKRNEVFVYPPKSKSLRAPCSVCFTSIKGSVTGKTVNGLVILDDTVKGDEASDSHTQKERAWNFFRKEVLTRKQHNFSVIAIGTRWSYDDLQGRMIDQLNYEYIRLPARCDDEKHDLLGRSQGEILWPELYSENWYNEQEIEVGQYNWTAMFQGQPYKEGLTPFADLDPTVENPDYYPPKDWVTTYGIDLAGYGKISNKTDYNVMVKLKTNKITGITYVDMVLREQQLFDIFFDKVVKFVEKDLGRIHWHTGFEENYKQANILRHKYKHINLITHDAKKAGKKYTRALNSKVITDFKNDVIRLKGRPDGENNLILDYNTMEFVKSLQMYTPAIQNQQDDDLDALTSAYMQVNHFFRKADKLANLTEEEKLNEEVRLEEEDYIKQTKRTNRIERTSERNDFI